MPTPTPFVSPVAYYWVIVKITSMGAFNMTSFPVENPTAYPPCGTERCGTLGYGYHKNGNCLDNSGMNDVWRNDTYW